MLKVVMEPSVAPNSASVEDFSSEPSNNKNIEECMNCENELKVEQHDVSSNCTETQQKVEEVNLTNSSDVPDINDTAASSSSSKDNSHNSPEDKQSSIYHIKWISSNNRKTPVVTQNENGPCPLLALINILVLRGRIKFPLVDIVTSEKLMQQVADCLFDSIPQNLPEDAQLNYEQNINDAMAVLPKLQTGLDVNVKFTGIGDFEYTPECIIFDLLRIPLYHGWLIDPQMTDVTSAVGTCSYNQLVEKIINYKSSSDPDNVTEALIAESFLEKTASQLTYHGLWKLSSFLHEDELCVLFRNNHFISLIKKNNILYQLVTDQGFLNENVAWETLDNIEGDGQFVDSNFHVVPPKPSSDVILPSDIPADQQINQDYLVALTLQEEQQTQQKNELEWEEFKKKKLGAADQLPDEELARRLQEEENRVRECQPPAEQAVPNTSNNRNNKKSECIIL